MNARWKYVPWVIARAAIFCSARAGTPVPGKSPRYCNPLPMVNGGGASASGDVTVIRDNGKYYTYCTGGGAWVSDDLVNWTLQRVAKVPVAPHVFKYNGLFYMCGNDGPLFKASNPLGAVHLRPEQSAFAQDRGHGNRHRPRKHCRRAG